MSALRVAVIAGGLSLEREVSLHSGGRIAAALESCGHDVHLLDVDAHLVDRLVDLAPDVAYLALHGRMGEDGTVQGLLELLGIPFTGPDGRASALAWDKVVTKALWRWQSLDTPSWISLSSEAIRDLGAARVLPRVVETLGLPLVVKPSQGGGSMGVGYVNDAAQLTDALIGSFRYHGVSLVEHRVVGTEIAISIVDDQILPAVEIDIAAHGPDDHYDFAARYTPGATTLHAPARLPDDVLEEASRVAAAAYAGVRARHVSRIDMIVDAEGRPWLLEVDTCPGMTETSLLPAAAEAAGMGFTELCTTIVDAALREAPARST